MFRGSKVSISPAPGNVTPSSGFCVHLHLHVHTDINKDKINLGKNCNRPKSMECRKGMFKKKLSTVKAFFFFGEISPKKKKSKFTHQGS